MGHCNRGALDRTPTFAPQARVSADRRSAGDQDGQRRLRIGIRSTPATNDRDPVRDRSIEGTCRSIEATCSSFEETCRSIEGAHASIEDDMLFDRRDVLFDRSNIPFVRSDIAFDRTRLAFDRTHLPFDRSRVVFDRTEGCIQGWSAPSAKVGHVPEDQSLTADNQKIMLRLQQTLALGRTVFCYR